MRVKKGKDFYPYLYILPAMVIILTFRFLPIVFTFVSSFYDVKLRGLGRFIGFANYSELITNPDFWRSLLWTVYFSLGVVPLGIILSLSFALFLNQKIKRLGIYRTAYFIPVVTSTVAVAMVWKWIYHKDGLFNNLIGAQGFDWLNEYRGIFVVLFEQIGINLPSWLGGPSVALTAIIIMSIWKGLGYNIIIFTAGLQNIPNELYEAGKIDGTNGWQSFRYITWPMLSPTTFYILIMSTITSFQAFAQVNLMTEGDPIVGTQIIVHYLYDKGFGAAPRYGYASAIALVLFFIILGMTIIQKTFLEKKVHYG